MGMGAGSGSGGNGCGIATTNNNQGNQTHSWEGTDSEETKEAITTMVSNAYNSLSERARGCIPAGVLSQIKALLEPPEINWKQVLRKMVGSVPVPYRKTRTRLNRRQPFRADLCGKLPKRTVNIVCAFDTSGSMSDDDLKYCMNEVFNIIKVYEGYKVTIIECDAEIQRVYQAKSIADVDPKMRGRGGTAFTPVIQYINGEKPYDDPHKYPYAGKFKDALMIYFTDGYGEYEIPKPKTYRNLWVVLKDTKCLSLKEPYGDVKSLSMDNDWKNMKNR
jgi:predicted metal-dependent peptidase